MNRQIRVGIWLVLLVVAFAKLAGAASVPNPTVTGPVPANAEPGDPSHDYPFFATTVDLASQGYVEEEFFFEGAANRYSTPALTTGSVIDGGHPYRTRMVVHRPASPDKFNGTVLLELHTLAPDYEHDAFWLYSHDHLMRRGYAWIGVSAQRLGIHQPGTGLKAWSPSRYGTLDVTEGGAILDDALWYDIFSQAAQAVRSPKGVDPMGGLHVERIIAAGGAQAANRLTLYHNSIHPLVGIFDAFFIAVGGGAIRTDLYVKIFKILTETTVAGNAVRQPDSDRFRKWEGAGSATIDLHLSRELAALQARDNVPPAVAGCDRSPFSRIPGNVVLNAALDHLVRWAKDNIQPPAAPEIELAALGPPVVIARDSFGNALGGIRLSQHAVPTATNTGVNSGPGLCSLTGSFQPFDDATLAALYADHNTYVIQVIQATLENLKAGFIVPEDAAATIYDAALSDIGRR